MEAVTPTLPKTAHRHVPADMGHLLAIE